jgi:hypothetical protein
MNNYNILFYLGRKFTKHTVDGGVINYCFFSAAHDH